jgi:hypothetical protein
MAMLCPMSVCNKIPSISLFPKRVQFHGSPLRPAEYRVGLLTAIGETRHDIAEARSDRFLEALNRQHTADIYRFLAKPPQVATLS